MKIKLNEKVKERKRRKKLQRSENKRELIIAKKQRLKNSNEN